MMRLVVLSRRYEVRDRKVITCGEINSGLGGSISIGTIPKIITPGIERNIREQIELDFNARQDLKLYDDIFKISGFGLFGPKAKWNLKMNGRWIPDDKFEKRVSQNVLLPTDYFGAIKDGLYVIHADVWYMTLRVQSSKEAIERFNPRKLSLSYVNIQVKDILFAKICDGIRYDNKELIDKSNLDLYCIKSKPLMDILLIAQVKSGKTKEIFCRQSFGEKNKAAVSRWSSML